MQKFSVYGWKLSLLEGGCEGISGTGGGGTVEKKQVGIVQPALTKIWPPAGGEVRPLEVAWAREEWLGGGSWCGLGRRIKGDFGDAPTLGVWGKLRKGALIGEFVLRKYIKREFGYTDSRP